MEVCSENKAQAQSDFSKRNKRKLQLWKKRWCRWEVSKWKLFEQIKHIILTHFNEIGTYEGTIVPRRLIFIQRRPKIWETKTQTRQPKLKTFKKRTEITTSNLLDPSNIKELVLKEQCLIKFSNFFSSSQRLHQSVMTAMNNLSAPNSSPKACNSWQEAGISNHVWGNSSERTFEGAH